MIDIRPDPAHPRGGFAELTLPGDKVPGETAEVSVYDNYSERFLGESGWQATRVSFGPYAVVRDGDAARLVIGPEIVNQIEEYANVRMHVGDVSHDIAWPDEIVPAPGAAKIGGIASAKSAQAAPVAPMAPRMPGPEPEASPEPEVDDGAETGDEENDIAEDLHEAEDTPKKSGGKTGLWIQLIVFLLLLAAAAYWFFVYEDGPKPEPDPEPKKAAEIVKPDPIEPATDTCTLDALGVLDGFAAQTAALRDCGADATADTALTLLEKAAAQDDADALRLFGEVYDKDAGDEVIEGTIGLTFADDPVTAADYYSRAVDAGSEEAKENLSALCTRLETMSETLAQGAFADHCGS